MSQSTKKDENLILRQSCLMVFSGADMMSGDFETE